MNERTERVMEHIEEGLAKFFAASETGDGLTSQHVTTLRIMGIELIEAKKSIRDTYAVEMEKIAAEGREKYARANELHKRVQGLLEMAKKPRKTMAPPRHAADLGEEPTQEAGADGQD